ncbi:MAG TPA: hypothetical protein VGM38_01680 [Pseudolysinimonas sp.]|jgi:hypothetical protein
MKPRQQLVIGLGIMIAGLVAVAAGAVVQSHDLVVGLILLFLVPQLASFCGAVVALIGLVRKPDGRSGSALIRTIIGAAALGSVGYGFGLGALGTLGQLPDYAAGLNGTFLPVPASLSVFLLTGTCLAVGLGLGILVSLIWWKARGRHLQPTAQEQSPG